LVENKNKRIVIGGVPGAGKTTLISLVTKKLNEIGQKTTVVVFGTVMFEEAVKVGLKSRDELRRLSIIKQRQLQEMAAKTIAELEDSIVIIDTHLFIRTCEGYYPGLPMPLLDILRPTHFIMVFAEPEEIASRRKGDTSRERDIVSIKDIQYELDISRVMVAACSIITGSPFIIVMNNDNKIDDAVSNIAKVLTLE
jgi:adenylate kinase